MKIELIAALTPDRVIGRSGSIPWHLPADLAHFKQLTLHRPLLLGRKTFESIGRVLPDREMLVLTREKSFGFPGVSVYHALDAVWSDYADSDNLLMVGGGAVVYQDCLPFAQKLHLTIVHADLAGDVFFPEWDPCEWQVIFSERHTKDERHSYDYTFTTLERIFPIRTISGNTLGCQ